MGASLTAEEFLRIDKTTLSEVLISEGFDPLHHTIKEDKEKENSESDDDKVAENGETVHENGLNGVGDVAGLNGVGDVLHNNDTSVDVGETENIKGLFFGFTRR